VDFPIQEYCERTGAPLDGPLNVERLEELQRAQIYAMPFENFDIQLGRGIDLTPEHLIEKLIRHKRGGYCFELNGLFLTVLKYLGFEARALLARVHITGDPTGRGHQLSLVSIADRDWVVDVGFGGPGPRKPMQLEHNVESRHDGRVLCLTQHKLGHMLQQKVDGLWKDVYSFDLTPVLANDIAYGNHFTSTHPSSFFTTSRVAVRAYPDGQSTLFNFRCATSRGDNDEVEELPNDERYLSILRERFGIELDSSYEDLASVEA
jgi:N-hydroxyarylamine O-acetyltransferase